MGEDQLFFTAISKLGYKIYWSKKIFVTEKVHKHRSNITWIKREIQKIRHIRTLPRYKITWKIYRLFFKLFKIYLFFIFKFFFLFKYFE